jgi:transcriptional regulator with XRE-family HTH domain
MARTEKTAFGQLVGICFGQVLRHYRRKARMSQETLAADADIERRYVQLLEKGTSTPSLEIFFRLARALKIDIREVVEKVELRILQKETDEGERSTNGQSTRARGRKSSPPTTRSQLQSRARK